jgi:hypothetical protein
MSSQRKGLRAEIDEVRKRMADKIGEAVEKQFGGDWDAARACIAARVTASAAAIEQELENKRRRKAASRPKRAHRDCCDGCRRPLDRRRRNHVELGPVLHDAIWRQIADPAEALCWNCILQRAVERLGRRPTWTDLRPCRWNLSGQPNSWFDLFVEVSGALPDNLDEWRSVGDSGEFAPLNFPRGSQ